MKQNLQGLVQPGAPGMASETHQPNNLHFSKDGTSLISKPLQYAEIHTIP
jgi:hypothetical protein